MPALNTKPPLLREHRLYQADWLLRYYGFKAHELLDEKNQDFNPLVDPKCNWALSHMEQFPVEINSVDYDHLLRVPGIGVRSAMRIVIARKSGCVDFSGLKKIGVVLKRAQYFITCSGKMMDGLKITLTTAFRALISDEGHKLIHSDFEQISIFDNKNKLHNFVIEKAYI